MNQEPITLALFNQSIAAAIRHFALLREKHTEIPAYLVISSHGRQVETGQPLKEIILPHPCILIDNPAKSEFLTFLRQPNTCNKNSGVEKAMQDAYAQKLTSALEFDSSQQFELRFHNLDYALIEEIQSDSLIDRTRTPQSKASIRIVLRIRGHSC